MDKEKVANFYPKAEQLKNSKPKQVTISRNQIKAKAEKVSIKAAEPKQPHKGKDIEI